MCKESSLDAVLLSIFRVRNRTAGSGLHIRAYIWPMSAHTPSLWDTVAFLERMRAAKLIEATHRTPEGTVGHLYVHENE